MIIRRCFVLLLIGLLVGVSTIVDCRAEEAVTISVYPTFRRQIDGIGKLDRGSLFAMCDRGVNFDQRVRSPERMAYLLGELGIRFGRSLGLVRAFSSNEKYVKEDPQRPGFVDLENLKQQYEKRQQPPNKAFSRFVGGRLDVALHGSHNAYPDFMGKHSTPESVKDPKHVQELPDNVEAAAEFAATTLKYNFTDFDRPRYYEPVNEPHWSFIPGEKLADWHVKTRAAVQAEGLDVKVGGPCLPVAYFYRNDFGAFGGIEKFMRNTNCELDFYSFHVYDYLRWDGEDLVGRVTSGLPLEGVLDFVQAHVHNEYGKQIEVVVSEHGGYISGSGDDPTEEEIGELMAAKYFPDGDGFEHEMEKRSIPCHVLVSAAIANTLAFLDHPHTIKKAVPFILLDSMGWDPKYYSTLYVPYDFTDRKRWVESHNMDFFRFFKGLQGERVAIVGGDPDLQTRAFVDGDTLMVVINNLSNVAHVAELKFPKAEEMTIRRYGRREDFRPSFTEETLESLSPLTIAGREAVFITAKYGRTIPEKMRINEVPCYGHALAVQPTKKKPARFLVSVPDADNLAYAQLRIAATRPSGADPGVVVKLNGKRIEVPVEDSAPRYDNGEKEYASTKIVDVDKSLIKKKNRVEVSFVGEGGGTVGCVVLRAGVKESVQAVAKKINHE